MKNPNLKPVGCFGMENASVKGFCNFLRNNIPLVISVSVMLFFTYGIRLFWYSIGVDTQVFMADKDWNFKWYIQIGRFGLSLLSRLLSINGFNPFTAFFTAFCLLWFSTLSWCYIIAIFYGNTGRNNKLIPFALLFMTSAVWAEQFYFLLQAAEVAFALALCPYTVYFLYKGFLDHEKRKIAYAFVFLVFMTAVYQSTVILACCGIFACFVLFQEHSEYEPEIYRKLCLKLFITLLAALAVYFFIDKIIVPSVFHIEKAEYIDNMNQWGKKPIKECILRILLLGYTLTVGSIPFAQTLANPVVAQNARSGMEAVELITNVSRTSGNLLLLPAVVLFVLAIIKTMRSTIPSGRRVLYLLAGIGVPMSIMVLALASGNRSLLRSLFALPFASAFMVFYLMKTCGRKTALAVTLCAMLTAAYQAQITAQLFYSDQMRYNEDVRLAIDLDRMITQAQPDTEKLPAALIGRYKAASRFDPNFLQGEVIGLSVFDWAKTPAGTTGNGLSFMRSLGMHYDMAKGQQMEIAFREAKSMPAYPDPGCVKRLSDVIVVRIAEELYYSYEAE